MKKILLRIAIGVVVLLILAVLSVGLFLNGIIKSGIETVGPKVTGVDVKLEKVRLSLFSGSCSISGLTVGNPPGYKTTNAISIGSATLALKPGSLLSDKVVIQKFELIAPEITFEGGLSGNNLGKILANVNANTGGGSTNAAAKPADTSPGKKLQIDDFLISAAKVRVSIAGLNMEPKTVTISDIHLSNLGQGPEGITTGELLKVVLPIIEKEALKVATTEFPELKKSMEELTRKLDEKVGTNLTNITKALEKATGGTATNLTKGLNELLKKK